MKKSQINIVSNWIFVLIGGSIILLLILSITFKQKSTFEYEVSETLAETIMFSMLSTLYSENYFTQIKNLPQFDFQKICFEDYLGIYIKNYESPISYVLFAPREGKGTMALSWSLPYKPAYPITNFVYFITPRNKIAIFNSSDGILQKMCLNLSEYFHNLANVKCYNNKEDLEEDLKKEIVTTLTVVTDRDSDISFYKLDEWRTIPNEDIRKQNLFLIKLNNDDFPVNVSVVYFVENQEEKNVVIPYMPFLIGLIVSGDPELFLCTAKVASKIASIIDKIIMKRANSLAENSIDECGGFYSAIVGATTELMEYESSQTYLYDMDAANNYRSKFNQVKRINDNSLVLNSCELMY